jgi:hypothetical protein
MEISSVRTLTLVVVPLCMYPNWAHPSHPSPCHWMHTFPWN